MDPGGLVTCSVSNACLNFVFLYRVIHKNHCFVFFVVVFFRLETLQQVANRVQRDCVHGEDKLALARHSLQSVSFVVESYRFYFFFLIHVIIENEIHFLACIYFLNAGSIISK